MRRRELLVGSGTVVVASLAGHAGGAGATDESSEAVDAALELVPSQSAVDATYATLTLVRTDALDDSEGVGYAAGQVVGELDALDPEDVSQVAMAVTEDYRSRIGAAVGTFDDVEPGETIETDGDWRLAEDGTLGLAIANDDEHLVFAGGPEGPATETVDAAVEAAEGDGESVLDAFETAADAVDRLEAHPFVQYLPAVPDGELPGVDADALRAVAAGFETPTTAVEDTAEHGYVFYPADGADLDDEAVTALVESIEYAELVESDIERDDDAIHVEATVRAPPQRDREAAPDARISSSVDAAEGAVEFAHRGGESIDAGDLELWLDGEELAGLPGVDGAFAAGDAVTVETDPLAAVELRWTDTDERVYYVYASEVVGRDAFEAETDFDAGTVEITYVGEATADPEKLALTHRSESGPATSAPSFADAYDALTAGDAVTVEDVGVDDWIRLELDVPPNPDGVAPTLLSHRVTPPRLSIHSREKRLVVSYWGEEAHDADEFEVLVDGEPAAVQLADAVDTLEPDADVELGEVSIGDEVVVEWNLPEDPIVVGEHLVVPRSQVRMAYDGADGTVTATHEGGDAVDAAALEARVDGDPAADRPTDEFDTFEPGDAFSLEAEPFAEVELVWIHDGEDEDEAASAGADGATASASGTATAAVATGVAVSGSVRDDEHRLASTVTAHDAFEAAYDVDAETVDITYVGEQDADPGRLELEHRGNEPTPADGSAPFFEGVDTLSEGDTTVVEDVSARDRLSVTFTAERDGVVHHRSIFRFTPEPRMAFSFGERDGDLVATYGDRVARDADAFRILADGEETDAQPADDHDSLEAGDDVDLGSFEAGTELVVQWVVPDEPVDLRTHVVVPDVEFAFDVDLEAGEATVEHAGGDAVDAADLSVAVEPADFEGVAWDGDGAVSEGDSTAVDLPAEGRAVVVFYGDRQVLDHELLDR